MLSVIYMCWGGLSSVAYPAYWLFLRLGTVEPIVVLVIIGHVIIAGFHLLGMPCICIWASKRKTELRRFGHKSGYSEPSACVTSDEAKRLTVTEEKADITSVEKELIRLKKQYEEGFLTEEVYNEVRKNIVRRL